MASGPSGAEGPRPYVVVLVELPDAGNVRMLGNLLGDPQQAVKIGAEVQRCSSRTTMPSRRSPGAVEDGLELFGVARHAPERHGTIAAGSRQR